MPDKELKFQNDSALNNNIKNGCFNTSINNENQVANEVDCDIKFEVTKNTKFVTSHDVVKKFSSVNMLSPAIKVLDSVKTLRFKQDIDEDWLKRCDDNILKDLKEIEVENSPKSVQTDQVTIPTYDKNYQTSVTLENNVTKQVESYSPLKTNGRQIDLNYKEKNSQSQCDVTNISHDVNDVGIKSSLNNASKIDNSLGNGDICNDTIPVLSQSSSKQINDSSIDVEKSFVSEKQSEDKVEDIRKSKKRKLSCVSEVSDSVSSKKSNHIKR